MSDKEINLKEKLRQALASTVRVISDDFKIKNEEEKNKNLNKLEILDLNTLNNKHDFIRARAETDSAALKKKIF